MHKLHIVVSYDWSNCRRWALGSNFHMLCFRCGRLRLCSCRCIHTQTHTKYMKLTYCGFILQLTDKSSTTDWPVNLSITPGTQQQSSASSSLSFNIFSKWNYWQVLTHMHIHTHNTHLWIVFIRQPREVFLIELYFGIKNRKLDNTEAHIS